MTSAVQLRVVPSVVEFDATHSVVLLCMPAQRRTASELAESLLALGFEAFVVHDLRGLEPLQGDRPALLVPMAAEFDTPVFRSRVHRALGRNPVWVGGEIAEETFVLLRRIQARLDALERERTHESPIGVADDDHEDDVGADVVQLPVSAPPKPPRAQRRDHGPRHVVIWPVLGAALTALGMAWVLPSRADPTPDLGEALTAAAAPEQVTPTATTPVPVPRKKRASLPPPPMPLSAVPASTPALATSQETAALENERITAADDVLVYLAPERPRDWYAAMDLCRGRTHAGLVGWTTPSSRQLHALSAAHALPEAPLWSRTRSAHSKDVAFIVHGKVGNVRSSEKNVTLSAAVCVRNRHVGPDGD